jgi:carbonic anhydrase/acetyltransferase-like protein (isoleucine patch superfamily)
MQLDQIILERGSSIGHQAVLLPKTKVGEQANIKPLSLIFVGEELPPNTKWMGSPAGNFS